MKFNRRARLDTSQVDDRRGKGRGAVAAGGGLGIIGILVVLFTQVLGGGGEGGLGDLGGLGGLQGQTAGVEEDPNAFDIGAECRTGADANRSDDCRLVATINSIQSYWDQTFVDSGLEYSVTTTNFFTGSVNTGGCGSASSAVGPFYCPADQQVYVDLSFFGELETRFGASGGDFAESYVLAHEYGHHVQNLLGISGQVRRGSQGAESDAVRLELQADCYAGLWAYHATTAPDASGQPFILELSDRDIEDALSAAAAVGDDHIQETATGRVTPENWTHGSSAQRRDWFMTGYRNGDPNRCDTFAVDDL